MEKTKKNLKLYSVLFLVLAIIDAFNIGKSLIIDKFSVKTLMERVETTEQMAIISFVIILALFVIIMLIKLTLGAIGFAQSTGHKVGGFHTGLAIFVKVVLIIALIFSFIVLIRDIGNFQNWLSLLSSLSSVIIVIYYIKYTKELRQEK